MAQTAERETAPKKTDSEQFGAVDETVSENAAPPERIEYPEVRAAIERGLADIAAGRVHKRQSYAEYADIEIED